MSNPNMSLPKSNFRRKFLYLFVWQVFVFGNFETCKVIVGNRDIYNAKKILNNFECVEVRILVLK